jgi:hypothetical protein
MKKHYETHVEDTDKLISVAGPVLDYKSWYEQYRKLMEEDDNSDIVYPFPTYDATSTEFNSLITSDEWSTNTKDYDI